MTPLLFMLALFSAFVRRLRMFRVRALMLFRVDHLPLRTHHVAFGQSSGGKNPQPEFGLVDHVDRLEDAMHMPRTALATNGGSRTPSAVVMFPLDSPRETSAQLDVSTAPKPRLDAVIETVCGKPANRPEAIIADPHVFLDGGLALKHIPEVHASFYASARARRQEPTVPGLFSKAPNKKLELLMESI